MNETILWSPGVTLEQIEKQVVIAAFGFYQGNKTQTSIALGISIRTLDVKLEKYKLDEKTELARKADELRKQNQWLKESRGEYTPNYVEGATPRVRPEIKRAEYVPKPPVNEPSAYQIKKAGKASHGANAGVHVKSVKNSAPESGVSVPERKEVQKVLSESSSDRGSRKGRG